MSNVTFMITTIGTMFTTYKPPPTCYHCGWHKLYRKDKYEHDCCEICYKFKLPKKDRKTRVKNSNFIKCPYCGNDSNNHKYTTLFKNFAEHTRQCKSCRRCFKTTEITTPIEKVKINVGK